MVTHGQSRVWRMTEHIDDKQRLDGAGQWYGQNVSKAHGAFKWLRKFDKMYYTNNSTYNTTNHHNTATNSSYEPVPVQYDLSTEKHIISKNSDT